MAYWEPFAGFVVLATAALVALTHASAGLLEEVDSDLASADLLVQTASSQAVFGVVLLGAMWVARIPADALGVAVSGRLVAVGVGVGVVLAAANEVGMRLLDAAGMGYDDDLREALTPESTRGWLLLFGVSLPIVAGVEELLFRGFLVGAFATGFEVSPWLLAVASSVVFGAGHTAQGYVGVVVTTLLGFALAAAYVATGSLLVVVVAHYVVNVAEFSLHARG